MKLESSRWILENNTKFYENPPSGSHVVSRGRTDMTKQMVDFRYFANAPIISTLFHMRYSFSKILTVNTNGFPERT